MRSSANGPAHWFLLACLAWLALASPLSRAAAPAAQPRFAPDPAGAILDITVAPESVPAAYDGLKWLVVAEQMLLDGPQPVWHRLIRYQVVRESGLEEGGQFNIHYQPAYQRVEVHAVDVLRDGQRLDRRTSSRMEVLRRESDLESRLLDGSLTVNVTVPDLRVGDIVEYRYSVVGENPVFGRGYYDGYGARYGVAVGDRRVDVLYPAGMPLRWRAPDDFKVSQQTQGALKRLQIRGRDLQAVSEYDDSPSSFDPYGRIDLSTAAAWADVSAWALPLYPRRFDDRAVLAPLAARLKLDPADPTGSALRATAFVQGEIRYTGLDMGLNSHAPNRPERVLERRFGDCKDKATLLIALLAEAGVRADPVLVNTRAREAVFQRLPSARAFDHVVVLAHLPEGEVWIDPTLAREQGDFADRRALGYRWGLPIAEGSDKLVAIPQPRPAEPQVDVLQHIALTLTEREASADFKVATRYRMGYADDVRGNFANNDVEKIGKDYLGYMQGYYEGLRAPAVPSTRDETSAFNVDEQYRLRWNMDADGDEFRIALFQLLDWLPKIGEQERSAPLALGGPRFGRQQVRATSSEGWAIKDQRDTVKNAYFRVERTVKVVGDELIITANWFREADEIPASELARVRRDVAEARDLLDYTLDLDGDDTPLISTDVRDWIWPLASVPLAFVALVGLWFARRRWVFAGMLYRPHATVSEQLQRVGNLGQIGWVLIGLSIGLDAWLELADRGRDWHGALWLFGAAVILVLMLLRWMVWAGLHQLAFRIIGTPVPFGQLLRANGQATAPLLVMATLGMIALGLDAGLLATDASTGHADLPGMLLMLGWFVIGVVWMMVSCVQATAALAGTGRGKALGALALATLGLFMLLLPFGVAYVAYTVLK